jgi:hypothetical protein
LVYSKSKGKTTLEISAPAGRYAAAATFLIGAFLSRYAWIWAGPASASDPRALFQLQRKT